MQIIADLQLHSKFSRAVSKDMTIPGIYTWAQKKGIDLIATGDWTHPLWMKEIEENLEEIGNGLLKIKEEVKGVGGVKEVVGRTKNPLFLLATEVSCIFSQGGKGRRIHTLIWVPTLDSARKISTEMTKQGCNLLSDGRPIIGLSSIQVAELVFSIEEKALIIPAHAWTPWFGSYGSMSGFDSLAEEFGIYADRIYAVETGLSSNPAMNWQINELDNRSIVSFSDAHSGPKLGREATVFDIPDGKLSYDAIYEAIRKPSKKEGNEGQEGREGKEGAGVVESKIAYTIEFYPEEGKYHFSGHRVCNIRWGPEETFTKGTVCPVCGKPLTEGVVQRVEKLAGRREEELGIKKEGGKEGVVEGIDGIEGIDKGVLFWRSETFPERPSFVMMVPLQEIIAECIEAPVTSPKTIRVYNTLLEHFHTEFAILLRVSVDEIQEVAGARIAEGIHKVRTGDILIDPGYDGVFGIVQLWKDGEQKPLIDTSREQLTLL